MHLNITPELVRELAARAPQRADETGIILTPGGWDIDVYPDGLPAGLTALTLEDVHAYLDSDDAELGDDEAEALATPPQGGRYRIPDEHGDYSEPDVDHDPRVVLPRASEDGYDGPGWEGAFWFDLARAVELIAIDRAAWRDNRALRQQALLITAGGRYLARTHSSWQGEFAETWTEVTPSEAAEWMYSADPDLITDATHPPLMAAARAAADLVAGVAAPEVPGRAYSDLPDRAWEVEDQAALVVRDAGIIATLVREEVAADLRKARAAAARIVVRAADGNQSEAARRLGLAQQTLAQLIR